MVSFGSPLKYLDIGKMRLGVIDKATISGIFTVPKVSWLRPIRV